MGVWVFILVRIPFHSCRTGFKHTSPLKTVELFQLLQAGRYQFLGWLGREDEFEAI